ncbi:MAG: nuclear transport factor 2 family protein [Anaerolineae bacterium]
MARSTEQVFQDHVAALLRGDVEAIMLDYAPEAFLLAPQGVFAGLEAIRGYFSHAVANMPNPRMDLVGMQVHDDLVLCAWTATFDTGSIPNGVDSFVIRDDRIHRQTCWMSVVPK